MIGLLNFFCRTISCPPFAAQIGWKRTALWKIKHLCAFAHGLLQEIELRMLPRQPRTVVIAFTIWRMIGLFATPQGFETQIFIPRSCMELSDSERSIPKARHRSSQVRSAT